MDRSSQAGAMIERGEGEDSPAITPALPPLAVGGLVVTRAALVAALRLYVPQVVDIEPLDGERFLLVLAGAASGDGSNQEEG